MRRGCNPCIRFDEAMVPASEERAMLLTISDLFAALVDARTCLHRACGQLGSGEDYEEDFRKMNDALARAEGP